MISSDMRIDHGGFQVFVPHELLNGSNVSTGLKQVSGKGMTQGMRGNTFGDATLVNRFPYGLG